ncbi:hypothetical protein CDD83_4582 [Cordyceps sp. RAO-2017]|nr:hypothetical protein CDD83_4582 [Cordyceps sp. RAO-2017]
MSASNLLVRHGPKPITLLEFREAVEAVCRPHFRLGRRAQPRALALAISGGVDSMALAFLFSGLLKMRSGIEIAGIPIIGAHSIVIDHQLRHGSAHEASCVVRELGRLGIGALVRPLSWSCVTERGSHPTQLSNLEGVARTMRYQMLGATCRSLQANSLFFAHHRDDQYETILMRLMAGHGYRGLRGIQEANDIPECYELHGVSKSGSWNERPQQEPRQALKPPRTEIQRRPILLGSGLQMGLRPGICDAPEVLSRQDNRSPDPHAQDLTPLECEDGGVVIYRPLLHFDKDRLIATCEANGIRWFDDHTNLDPTLTTRNAIRHVTRTFQLPKALRKTAILELSDKAKRRTRYEEAEAKRLLVREAVVRSFDPNVGTLAVEIPCFCPHRRLSRRLYASARAQMRKRHRRVVAAIMIRKLIDYVTPEVHLPPLSNLDNAVTLLFPELCYKPSGQARKAFSVAGVLFDPVEDSASTNWILSRAPYPASRLFPERKLPGGVDGSPVSGNGAPAEPQTEHRWRGWETAKIWDWRFWIQISTRVQTTLHVLPFLQQHAKAFRLALPREQRDKLERVLRRHARGKVRFSLPALYSSMTESGEGGVAQSLTLLALPSLGIHVPGLERWVKYEVRDPVREVIAPRATQAIWHQTGRGRDGAVADAGCDDGLACEAEADDGCVRAAKALPCCMYIRTGASSACRRSRWDEAGGLSLGLRFCVCEGSWASLSEAVVTGRDVALLANRATGAGPACISHACTVSWRRSCLQAPKKSLKLDRTRQGPRMSHATLAESSNS